MKTSAMKIFALILALVMLMALPACGSNASGSSAGTASAPAPATSSGAASASGSEIQPQQEDEPVANGALPISQDPITVSVWIGVNPMAFAHMENGMASNYAYAELNKRTNIYFDWMEMTPEMAGENFNIAMASEEYADIYVDGPTQYSAGMDASVNNDVFVNIDKVIGDWCPNLVELFAKDPTAKRECYTDSGYLVGFPQFYDEVRKLDFGPVTRGDWLTALNIEAPKTYDQWYEYLKAIKAEYGAGLLPHSSGIPMYGYLTSGYGVLGSVLTVPSFSMPFYQENGKVKFGVIEPGYKDFITMAAKWYGEGLFCEEFVSEQNPYAPSENHLTNDKAGIFYTDQWNLSGYSEMVGNGADYVAIPDPVLKEGDTRHFLQANSVNTIYWSVSTACEELEKVCRMFDYMYSEEGALLMNYGVEGVTFEYVDGKPAYTDLIAHNPDGLSMDTCFYCYISTNAPYVREVKKAYPYYTENEVASVEIWAANSDSANILSSSVTMTSEESEKYAGYINDIATYIQENVIRFITGEKSLDDFDSFVAQINDMGIGECIKIYQAAYDRYMAR